MKIDTDLWLLATLGSGLLVAGGAIFRSAFQAPRLPPAPLSPPAPAAGDPASLTRQGVDVERLREELSTAIAVRDAQRGEIIEQRLRAELEVQAAMGEVERLTAELQLERTRTHELAESEKDLYARVVTLDEELKHTKTGMPAPGSLASLQGEVHDLRRMLAAATDDRDTARARIEVLERLVEGVRARSRELTEELRALKGHP
jgi:hypothetical protein